MFDLFFWMKSNAGVVVDLRLSSLCVRVYMCVSVCVSVRGCVRREGTASLCQISLFGNVKRSSKLLSGKACARLTFVNTYESNLRGYLPKTTKSYQKSVPDWVWGRQELVKCVIHSEKCKKSCDFVREWRTSMSPSSNEKHTVFEN